MGAAPELSGSVIGALASCTLHSVRHAEHPAISVVAQPVQSVVHASSVEAQLLPTQLAQDEPTIPERSASVHVAVLLESVLDVVPSFPDPESFGFVAFSDASLPFPLLLPPKLPLLLDEQPKAATDDPMNSTAFSTSTLRFMGYPSAHENDSRSGCEVWEAASSHPSRTPTDRKKSGSRPVFAAERASLFAGA